jgi:heat shock protein HtpX
MLTQRYFMRKIINIIQSILILGVMAIIFAVIGLMVAGVEGLIVAILIGTIIFLLGPSISPAMVLRIYKARLLRYEDVPALYRVLERIAENAHLNNVPELYYVPSNIMNAFSVGRKNRAAIALTDGLLRSMNLNEISGILAHEASHIEHNDLWVMGLADSISRFTNIFSMAGFIMLALYLPAILMGNADVQLWSIMAIVIAPYLSLILQLALSRTREYDADLNAVRLTGDPRGLARALGKLESYPVRVWDILFMPGRKAPAPSVLRTHPNTGRRIKRLLELAGKDGVRVNVDKDVDYVPGSNNHILPDSYKPISHKPRWRFRGF